MNCETKKLKILIPIMGFSKSGGIRVLTQLANHWKKMGHEVTIATYFESIEPYYEVEANIEWIGMDGEKVETNSTAFKARNSFLNRCRCLYRYIKRNVGKYDVVLANDNLTVYPVWLASKADNYYYIQAYEPEFYSDMSIRDLVHKTLAWFTYFLPLTKVVNADLYKNYNNIRSEYVIKPGLDLSVYYPKEIRVKSPEEMFLVGCIGRKEEWKGSNDVGEAVRLLHSEGLGNVKLKVAFNPVDYPEHELVFPDGDSNLADYYRSLDIMVAPGHIQLGAVHYPVIEAMACNVPVITTGYFPANQDNSFIVPVKRPDKIADVIKVIVNDYSIAYNKTLVAQKAIKEFDWTVVSSEFIDIFAKNLKKNSISQEPIGGK